MRMVWPEDLLKGRGRGVARGRRGRGSGSCCVWRGLNDKLREKGEKPRNGSGVSHGLGDLLREMGRGEKWGEEKTGVGWMAWSRQVEREGIGRERSGGWSP